MTGEVPKTEYFTRVLWVKGICSSCGKYKLIDIIFFKCKKCLPNIILVDSTRKE